MILASTNPTASLEELAELTDKVMDVAAPSICEVNATSPLAAEVEQLRGDVLRLEKLVKTLVRHRSSSRPNTRSSRTPTKLNHPTPISFAGITGSLAPKHRTVSLHVLGSQTRRPATSSDKCRRPITQRLSIYITNRANSLRFLVDTGAEVSIVPPSCTERSVSQGSSPLQAVNGSSIVTFGVRCLTLDLGLHQTFLWVFVIADIPHPIIGADFLSHFGLHVDIVIGH